MSDYLASLRNRRKKQLTMSDYLASLRDRMQADLRDWETRICNIKRDLANAEIHMRREADELAEIDAAIVVLGRDRGPVDVGG